VDLKPGQWVQVKRAAEIASTLDAAGATSAMPFMPEMVPFLGRRLQVVAQAHKTCDTIEWSGLRRLDDTVHLVEARCDGSAHGGCQAGCLLFWNMAWLTPLHSEAGSVPASAQPAATPEATQALLRQLTASAAVPDDTNRETWRWRCQATALRDASAPLPWWEPRQYVRDVRVNGTPVLSVLRGLLLSVINKLLRRVGHDTVPGVAGPNRRTPHQHLDLVPGELVRVKSQAEIRATLDARGRNRGLSFDIEMIPYCGGQFRVLRRVDRLIDEQTGRMTQVPGDCIVLEGATCTGMYHRFCPRRIFPYWREIWLERVAPAPADGV
jgi:hypothetical protein